MRRSRLVHHLLPLLAVTACATKTPGGPDSPTPSDTDGAVAGPTCVTPSVEARYAVGDVAWTVPVVRPAEAGDAYPLLLRPIVVDGTGEGTLEVAVDGPVLLHDAEGLALRAPLTLASDELPVTLLAGAGRRGTGMLTVTPSEDCEAFAHPLRAEETGRPALRRLAGAVDTTRLVGDGEAIEVSLDPLQHSDRVGVPYDVYVVAHRDPAAWAADPTLTDISGGVEEGAVAAGALATGAVVAWPASRWTGDGPLTMLDVVFDFDRDGTLSAGDIAPGLVGGGTVGVTTDLSTAGPYTPTMRRYNAGGIWRRQEVWWPQELTVPAPLVVIAHGNGHDYTWYDHLARHLSSWGYVVMSHANNTEPGIATAATATVENTDAFLEQVDGLFDGALAGLVDGDRIAWVGHSRGGEGVVRAANGLLSGQYTPTTYDLSDLRLISSIAPTVFQGVSGNRPSRPGGVSYHLIAGAADGDVTGGADCGICQSFRIAAVAEGPLTITYLHGASHNVFHNGGGFDDGRGPDRLNRGQLHPSLTAWYLALMAWHLEGAAPYAEVFTRHPDLWRPPGISPDLVVASLHRPTADIDALLVDGFQDGDLATADLGTVTATGFDDARELRLQDANIRFTWSAGEPSNGLTWTARDGTARGLALTWTQPSSLSWSMPAQGVRRFDDLTVAVAQATRHPQTTALGGDVTLSITLADEGGTQATLRSDVAAAVGAPYPRTGLGSGTGWADEFHGVRLPLRAFQDEAPDLDLRAITGVTLAFGDGAGSAVGSVVLDGLAFEVRP